MTSNTRLPDDFAEALAWARLGRIATRVIFHSAIGSTNDAAAALAAADDGAEGVVVCADEQTAGRGRRGHVWFSPPGSGLYVSVVLRPGAARIDPDRAMMLVTLMAGVALVEGIERATGLRADLKWPNDLLVGRRKLAGILSEAVGAGATAVRRASRLSSSATASTSRRARIRRKSPRGRRRSRRSSGGRSTARSSSPKRWQRSRRRYDDLLDGRFDAILDAWRHHAPSACGARVSWTAAAGSQAGVTAGIDDRGALMVRVGDRVERIVAGELSWG